METLSTVKSFREDARKWKKVVEEREATAHEERALKEKAFEQVELLEDCRDALTFQLSDKERRIATLESACRDLQERVTRDLTKIKQLESGLGRASKKGSSAFQDIRSAAVAEYKASGAFQAELSAAVRRFQDSSDFERIVQDSSDFMAIADLVKRTLGPKGMDKILQSTGRGREVTVTNDGATILKSLHIDNAATKVLVDISKVQDDEVGDGTTSVVVLAGELLREAEKLVAAKIHPMTIIAGYRMAAECARDALLRKVVDNKEDAEKFKEDLMRIARTTLSSKILSQDKEHFAELAVDAVMRLKGSTNLEAIQIIKKPGGSLTDSFLDEGFILDKKIGIGQPKRIENANILVANTAMDTDKVKIYGARVRVDSMSKVAEIEGAEKEKMREKVQKIIGHGINCFVNRQLIYNFPEELFADAGILAIEHADFEGIERLALVTGGEIASTFDNPESVRLGHCKLIEEIMIGEDKLIHFSGVELGQACTIVLRGASNHVLDEAERSLHDALCVLSQTVIDSRVLLGGGWPEMTMAKEVDELARKTPGKKSHAIEAFSRALSAIPTIIADNAGLDSAELVAQLRAEHQKEGCTAGIDVISGSVGDMAELGISEAFKVKQAVLLSATEAAEMILRVDEIITCAPRRREDRM